MAGAVDTGSSPVDGDDVALVRAFNRLYTAVIGVLDEGLVATPWSLAEARIIYEVAIGGEVTSADLRARLGVDRGWVSRLVAKLDADGLVTRRADPADARRRIVSLTPGGERAFAHLDVRSSAAAEALLASLPPADRRDLVEAMAVIGEILGGPPVAAVSPAVVLRPPAPGDLGWIVERNAAVYAQQYGWDETYEALVARIVADFAAGRDAPDARREAAWIAEVDGLRAGCVLCVADDERTARLRLLLVEPAARGAGIGSRLVEECVRFARRARYQRLVLWTNDVLTDARRLYERAGFVLVDEEPHRSFGHDLVGQTWALDLHPPVSSDARGASA